MPKTWGSAVIILVMTFCLSVPAPARTQPAAGQNNANQSQMSSESLSPQAQAELVKKIQRALITLPNFGVFDNIAFRLQGRTVILEGQVTDSVNKPDAENAVKKIEGVDKVVNNIQVLPPGQLDNRIRRQVYDAIYNYGPFFKYKNNRVNPPIRIIVQNANVTLYGVVDTEADKNAATIRVKQVSDVLGVTNDLRVVKP